MLYVSGVSLYFRSTLGALTVRRKRETHQVCCSHDTELGLWFNSLLRSVFPEVVLGLMSESQLRHLGDNFLYWCWFILHFCVIRWVLVRVHLNVSVFVAVSYVWHFSIL